MPRIELIVKSKHASLFKFRALPDTGCTTTVITENLRKTYSMKLQPCHDKLVTADDLELDCRVFVDITVDDIPTKALVTNSLHEELIIGWPDMIHLGIISPNFPECHHAQINTITDIVEEDA